MEKTREKISLEMALQKYEPMVQKTVGKASTNAVCSRDDLVQEGRMAIVSAYHSYDASKGATLTTWTFCLIKDAIANYQKENLSCLTGGSYLHWKVKKGGGDVSVEALIDTGVAKKTALAATRLMNSFSAASLSELENVISNPFEHELERFEWQKYLSPEEAYAVARYYGFFDEPATMKEIGEELGRSRKSISYMLNKAIVKLRHVPDVESYFLD